MIGSSGASFVTGAMICGPEHRMGVHHHPLLAGQPLLLQQDAVRHADLADVMEQPAPLEGLELRLRDTCISRPMSTAIMLDPLAVLAGVRVALVDGAGQRADGLREHLAHLDESVDARPGSCTAEGQRASVAHQLPARWKTWAISHASGARAS